jgi:hypothetical protein
VFSLLLRTILNWQKTPFRKPALELIYYQLEPDFLARSDGRRTTTRNVDISLKQSLDPIIAREVYAVLFPSTGRAAKIANIYSSLRETVASDIIIGIIGRFVFFFTGTMKIQIVESSKPIHYICTVKAPNFDRVFMENILLTP